MAKVINQAYGEGWAFYNGDCVLVMDGLPENSVDFIVYSPPFSQLYIYSDSVADMGNSTDDEEFFEGYQFALRGLYRIAKPGAYHAIHCKDLMRYMSSHGYSGQDDFSGNIIQAASAEGWVYQKRITVWKNPVIEMQRTKTYGLLHKSFATRAEVVRQGAPDYVLIFKKTDTPGVVMDWTTPMPPLPQMVVDRCKRIWSNDGENGDKIHVGNETLEFYTPERIDELSKSIAPGRIALIRCIDIPRKHLMVDVGKYDMAGEIIRRFEAQGSWKFHTRLSFTDGSYLVGFRNWTPELIENYKELNGQVTHSLKAPAGAFKHIFRRLKNSFHNLTTMANAAFGNEEERSSAKQRFEDEDAWEEHHEYQNVAGITHPDYVGNEPPTAWSDDSYYSVLVWQRYASPVWNDIEGLPKSHPDCWMKIVQTDVLNYKVAKEKDDEKHICPLQLDLIERLVLEYSKQGEVIFTPYGGISSELHTALKLERKAIGAELKSAYWSQGVRYLKQIEQAERQLSIF